MRPETFIDRPLQDKLHRLAYHLLQDDMDAKDAVQDALCNLWSYRVPASSDEARFRLYTILKNVCLNKLKRKRRLLPLTECDKVTDPPSLDETQKLKTLLLASLSPLQRRIFEMATFQDLEYDIIAEHLNMSVDAVRMNMSRARKKMREIYKNI